VITVDFDRLHRASKTLEGFKILDIGCGPGRHTCSAYQLKNVVAIGVDLNFDELLEAKQRLEFHDGLGEHGGGCWGLSVADITRLPFEDNFFDLVICSEVLEHIPDELSAVKEIVRVAKPGNNIVVSVPRYLPEKICWGLSDDYFNANQGHIRIYKKNRLIALMESAGSKNWSYHYAHSLHAPYWWLKCLVGPTRENSTLVNLYHRFLVWDMMKKPKVTRFLDYLLNPVLGKSTVLYFKKNGHS
jgi:ubiquinone/menaquinone biosynthesis C-methylase UbiE